jgi:hypothetical protein
VHAVEDLAAGVRAFSDATNLASFQLDSHPAALIWPMRVLTVQAHVFQAAEIYGMAPSTRWAVCLTGTTTSLARQH